MDRRICWALFGHCAQLRVNTDIRRSRHCPDAGYGLDVARCKEQRQECLALDLHHAGLRLVWAVAVFDNCERETVNPTINVWVFCLSFAVAAMIRVLQQAGLDVLCWTCIRRRAGEGRDLTTLIQHVALLLGLLFRDS